MPNIHYNTVASPENEVLTLIFQSTHMAFCLHLFFISGTSVNDIPKLFLEMSLVFYKLAYAPSHNLFYFYFYLYFCWEAISETLKTLKNYFWNSNNSETIEKQFPTVSLNFRYRRLLLKNGLTFSENFRWRYDAKQHNCSE